MLRGSPRRGRRCTAASSTINWPSADLSRSRSYSSIIVILRHFLSLCTTSSQTSINCKLSIFRRDSNPMSLFGRATTSSNNSSVEFARRQSLVKYTKSDSLPHFQGKMEFSSLFSLSLYYFVDGQIQPSKPSLGANYGTQGVLARKIVLCDVVRQNTSSHTS